MYHIFIIHIFIIHSSVGRLVGCFCFLPTVNKVAMNLAEQGSEGCCWVIWIYAKEWHSWVYGRLICSCLKVPPSYLYTVWNRSQSYQQWTRARFSPNGFQHLFLFILLLFAILTKVRWISKFFWFVRDKIYRYTHIHKYAERERQR